MPLDKRYSPSDVRAVLYASKLNKSNAEFIPEGFGITVPSYYTTNTAIVIAPSTDTLNSRGQMLQTISEGLSRLKNEDISNKNIYIPVTEEQKILGLFKRNHWITLEYNPETKQATLLDSRPWIISFLYPCKAMKNQLEEGLGKIYKEDIKISFKKKYQGVQRNDIHCGAWTCRNILDLSGGIPSAPTTMQEQINKYKPTDEGSIVEENIGLTTQKEKSGSSMKTLSQLGRQQENKLSNNPIATDDVTSKNTKTSLSTDDFEPDEKNILSF